MLPTKNQIRESGKKKIGCAILDTWLRKEPTPAPYLLHILKEQEVNLPERALQSSSVDEEATEPSLGNGNGQLETSDSREIQREQGEHRLEVDRAPNCDATMTNDA